MDTYDLRTSPSSGQAPSGTWLHHPRLSACHSGAAIDPPPGLKDRREEAAGSQFRDGQQDVAYLGGEQAWPAAVAVAAAFLGSLMAIGTEHGGDLQFDQHLQAVAGQLGICSPTVLPSSSDARAEASESALDMVRLVEVVLKPGKRACRPLSTSDNIGAHAQRISNTWH
jgi:hypothetical protein